MHISPQGVSLLSDIGFPVKACKHPTDQLFNFKACKNPTTWSIIQFQGLQASVHEINYSDSHSASSLTEICSVVVVPDGDADNVFVSGMLAHNGDYHTCFWHVGNFCTFTFSDVVIWFVGTESYPVHSSSTTKRRSRRKGRGHLFFWAKIKIMMGHR